MVNENKLDELLHEMFTPGHTDVEADRLALQDARRTDLGGWSKPALRALIQRVLND